jgi:hypothetical protein
MWNKRRAGVSRKFAWWPVQMSSGSFVWLKYYWAVYKITGVVPPGRLFKNRTDRWVKNTENLTEYEYFLIKMQK